MLTLLISEVKCRYFHTDLMRISRKVNVCVYVCVCVREREREREREIPLHFYRLETALCA